MGISRREELESTIRYLWNLLDDIDTYSDMAKENDKLYRNLVYKALAKRWETGITTDGYTLNISKIKVMPERAGDGNTMAFNSSGDAQ